MNPVENQTVCLNAMYARHRCSSVSHNTNVCYDAEDWPGVSSLVRTCRVVRTNDQFTRDGDSGGPWFNGGTAFGIHSGAVTYGDLFTRIGAVGTFLDADLMME